MTGRPRIGLCTDSSAELPAALVERFDVEVVPLTVVIDDEEHLDGVDLDADAFYARFTPDHRPVVSKAQPSPGQFAVAYDDLAARGCTEILSVHVSPAVSSGTINSARLAARTAPVPVRIVDSGTAGFGVGCSVWAAAEAIAAGACLDLVAKVAESAASRIGNVFLVGAEDPHGCEGSSADELVAISQRVPFEGSSSAGIPVLTLRDGKVTVLERARTIDAAIEVMAAYLTGWGDELRVAIGHAASCTAGLTARLADRVRSSSNVTDVIDYRVGPAMGVHTGPGTVGAFTFPGRLADIEALSASHR